MLIAQVAAVAWFGRRRIMASMTPVRIAAAAFGVGVMAIVLGLGVWVFESSSELAVAAFGDRLYEDTRTQQAAEFFARVPIETLLRGAGYPASSEYTSEGVEGIDLGYVNAAYVGGLPMATFALFLFAWLPFASRRCSVRLADAVFIAACAAFGLRMASSTVLKVCPQVIVACLLSGRCYAIAYVLPRKSRTSTPLSAARLAGVSAAAELQRPSRTSSPPSYQHRLAVPR
jgi:hypothetical protein